MERRAKDPGAVVGFGAASFHLDRAALCCEASCEAIFDMVPTRASRSVACPSCGGSSWVPLSTIVPSLRIPPPRMVVVPIAERIRA
jgi:hypothetical protein